MNLDRSSELLERIACGWQEVERGSGNSEEDMGIATGLRGASMNHAIRPRDFSASNREMRNSDREMHNQLSSVEMMHLGI